MGRSDILGLWDTRRDHRGPQYPGDAELAWRRPSRKRRSNADWRRSAPQAGLVQQPVAASSGRIAASASSAATAAAEGAQGARIVRHVRAAAAADPGRHHVDVYQRHADLDESPAGSATRQRAQEETGRPDQRARAR